MSGSDLVRFSRDGDQFHYRWAARRCLRLLNPRSDLVAVSIEGVSQFETGVGARISEGEEIVDVAEYYGSPSFMEARRVDYIQLKHSTARTGKAWTASELAGPLKAFGARYQALRKKYGRIAVDGRLTYSVKSNRPFSERVLESVADLASGVRARHAKVAAELRRHAALPDNLVQSFFAHLSLDGSESDFRVQADRLHLEIQAFFAGNDADAALRLKDLVTRKATSDGATDPSVIADDVLQAI